MCDTMVATPQVTSDGVMIFAKNSNRQPNEAHHVINVPAQEHAPGSTVHCTYIEIAQVEHTYATLLAKPFWMWGAEMGVNEHSVAIGNEAIFSKVPANKKPALLGMDLLRLGLERSATARQAVTVMTGLLEEHGQGGNCGFEKPFYYHNSFLIADPVEAWLVETVDRRWAAKQVTGVYTISNGLTIGRDFDLASADLVQYALQKGWCKGEADFDFANCYSDYLFTTFGDSRYRRECSLGALSAQAGQISIAAAASTLRLHKSSTRSPWRPDKGIAGLSVCCHAGLGPIRTDQTTGSMISYLKPGSPTHFFTGTAAPCTSIFKPAWVDSLLPNSQPAPTGVYDPETLFWQHERLHRATITDYPTRIAVYQEPRDALESQFIQQALAAGGMPANQRSALTEQCFQEAAQAAAGWEKAVLASPKRGRITWHYRSAWDAINQKARLPD